MVKKFLPNKENLFWVSLSRPGTVLLSGKNFRCLIYKKYIPICFEKKIIYYIQNFFLYAGILLFIDYQIVLLRSSIIRL